MAYGGVLEIVGQADGPDHGDRVVDECYDDGSGGLHVAEAGPDVDHDQHDRHRGGQERIALRVAGDLRVEVADLLELRGLIDAFLGQVPDGGGGVVFPIGRALAVGEIGVE